MFYLYRDLISWSLSCKHFFMAILPISSSGDFLTKSFFLISDATFFVLPVKLFFGALTFELAIFLRSVMRIISTLRFPSSSYVLAICAVKVSFLTDGDTFYKSNINQYPVLLVCCMNH